MMDPEVACKTCKTMLPMGIVKNHIKSHFDDDVSLVRYVQGSSGLEPNCIQL